MSSLETPAGELQFCSPLEGALYMIGRGMAVFPVKAYSREPWPGQSWMRWATRDEERVTAFAEKHPQANWAVKATGFVIVDLDQKGGKQGLQVWKALQKHHGAKAPPTFTVRSPNGGFHLYYAGPNVRNGANLFSHLGLGLDVRSHGGYVVAPGSRVKDPHFEEGEWRDYVVYRPLDFEEVPEWLLEGLEEEEEQGRVEPVLDEGGKIYEGSRQDTLARVAGRLRGIGMETDLLVRTLQDVNQTCLAEPLGESEVQAMARRYAKYPAHQAALVGEFAEEIFQGELATEATGYDMNKPPKMVWYMRNRYAPGYISILVSPGGVGKSRLALVDAISMVTGKPLSGFEVPEPENAWLHNTEDPVDDLHRRLAGAASHFKLKPEELEGLYLSSGRTEKLVLAKTFEGRVVPNRSLIDKVVSYITEKEVKLWIIDPMKRIHACDENSNEEMDEIAQLLQRIMDRTGCAIGLVHHTRKQGLAHALSGNMDAARGASSLAYAARIVHTLARMTKQEATRLGLVESRGRYVRLDVAKDNLSPPAEHARWYKLHSERLPTGDSAGVMTTAAIETPAEQEPLSAEEKDELVLKTLRQHSKIGGDYPIAKVAAFLLDDPTLQANFRITTQLGWQRKLSRLLSRGYEDDDRRFEVYYREKRKMFLRVLPKEDK